MSREEENRKQRERRKKNGNKNTKKYEKTKKGFLVRCYRNMLSRVTGVTKNKNHLYLGKSILEKDDFYDWALNDADFNILFDEWVESDYERRLTPSIDRLDTSEGYFIDNMRFISFSDNCRLGALNRWNYDSTS